MAAQRGEAAKREPGRELGRGRASLRLSLRIAGVLLAIAVLGLVGVSWAVHRSVPTLDGRVTLGGLSAPLEIRRDAAGTAVVAGANRLDVARGLGFVHAQERFFEMDVTRRSAAGELSGLFGDATLDRDKLRRVHRLRARLALRVARLDPDEQALLQAYADGVNAGLAQLGARPWQYLLLRARPQPWQPVDSLLVIAEMFWMLQGSSLDDGFKQALLRERGGDALVEFLAPRGGRWDAALDGSVMPAVDLPGAELLDMRKNAPAGTPTPAATPTPTTSRDRDRDRAIAFVPMPGEADGGTRDAMAGSNNWAISGARSTRGTAMLSDDMHLGLSVPSIWFRAQLEIGQGAAATRAEGVTLPGLPSMVAGSNGHVAWGFTNGYGQWFDWIKVPRGTSATRLTHVTEILAVKGAPDESLDVVEFDGAPVVTVRDGQAYALRWVADQGEAYNVTLDKLLQAQDVAAATAIGQRAGMPHQNLLVADSAGHIAWTIAGRLWAGPRLDHHARFAPTDLPPVRWLAPADYPRLDDPATGQLWTANARQLAGAGGALIGDGGFDVGARAQQIRDRLSATPRFDEATLGALQFDDDARFMRTWRDRIVPALSADAGAAAARPTPTPLPTSVTASRAEAIRLLQAWNGQATADQAAYRLLHDTRQRVVDALWVAWTTPLLGDLAVDSKQRADWPAMFEYSATRAIDARTASLLPTPYRSWDDFLAAQVDAAADDMTRHGQRPLAQASWGEANASHLQNLFSRALPALAPWLDMPSLPQSGDVNLPHVAAAAFGQSERLVVAPGHEERATLTMPGGQSGHPMSPYYGAGQDAWAAGRSMPLLAGATRHTLRLVP